MDTRVSLHDPWLVAVVCLGRAGWWVAGGKNWQISKLGRKLRKLAELWPVCFHTLLGFIQRNGHWVCLWTMVHQLTANWLKLN